MIREFLESWPLFHGMYEAGFLVALVLSLAGVIVVARDQIFIGAAVAQASTLGIALAMWLGSLAAAQSYPALHAEWFQYALGVVFSIAAALLTGRSKEAGAESHEAITGWVFLLSASVSILIVAHSPHGLEEVQRLVSSSIIGATDQDVYLFAALAAGAVTVIALAHRRILLAVIDPVMAEAVGLNRRRWNTAMASGLGVVIGLSIHVSGLLYAFGCLVLPAMIAKNLCREVGPMFLVAPLLAVAAAVAGFVLANHYDFPPGQMTVALLCAGVLLAWIYRAVQRQFTSR